MSSKLPLLIDPPVIAHRGASRYAPENTLAAIRKTKELGINWVELDVCLTKDNQVVVIHDETLDRTTHTSGFVCDYLYDDIKKLDAGLWFSSEFAGEKIPTLSEVILLLNELKLSANIEVKAQQGKEESTVKYVLATLHDHWRQEGHQFFLSSFSLSILKYIRQHSSTILLGFLMDSWQENWQQQADELAATIFCVNYEILNFERIHQIKLSQKLLLAYTVNNPLTAKELFGWGVDAVFSDDVFF